MITPEQLCKALTSWDGEGITDLKQAAMVSFSGEELLEFINGLPEKVSREDIEQTIYQAVLQGKSATTVLEVKAETFIDRLIAERDQLSDRLLKLEGFLSNKTKATEISGPTQVAMLIEQYQHMAKYLNVLDQRIDNLASRAEKAIEFKLPPSN